MGNGNRRRILLLSLLGVTLILATLLMFREPPETPPPGPRIGKAGQTTDVIPKAWRAQTTIPKRELARASHVLWQDVVWTERAARARLAIVDGSILNLGPETRLQILPQDRISNQSALVLTFGKIRAEVLEKSREGRRFQIRTPTAVIGVVGTEFYVDAAPETTRVICLKGEVRVRNRQVEVVGEEILTEGKKTEVAKEQPPAPQTTASPAEIAQALATTTAADYVPDITLPDRQGNQVNLRQRAGRALVINYWAVWAPPAIAQIPLLNSLYAEFRDQGVDFIGIAMDTGGWNAINQFEQRTPIDYLVLLDEGGRAQQAFGVRGIPLTIFVDREGRIIHKQRGRANRATLRRHIQPLL